MQWVKIMKKIISIMLCIGLVISLFSGCKNNSSSDVTGNTAEDPAGDSADLKSADENNGNDTDLKKLSIFVNMSWYPVDSFTGKIPDAVKKATGVDLDVTIATDSSQLGVMIASEELPDLVFTDANLNELSNSGVCYSLDELKETTGVDFSNSENYEERTKIAKSLATDGQAYTLLNNYNTQQDWEKLKIGAPGQASIFYRKDLLDEAGISVPANLDEFYDCLGKVKDQYPEMTPFGLGGYWKLQSLSNWYGVSSEQYDEGTGAFQYESTTDSYKDFLAYCNKLYRAGYITAEDYANENEADGHQKAYNDGCVFYAWFLSGSNLTQLQTNATKDTAEWSILAPLGEAPIGSSRGWAGAFISKNCSDPKAAAAIVSYLNTVEGSRMAMWGVEGEDYTLDEDGVPQFSDNYLSARANTDKFYSEYNTYFYFGSSNINEIYMNYSGMEEDKLKQFTAYSKGYKNYPALGIAKPVSTSDEGVIKSKLDEIKKNYEAKVVFTDTDEAFESGYKEYMDALKKTGVERYNEYMTKKIAEVKAEYGFTN